MRKLRLRTKKLLIPGAHPDLLTASPLLFILCFLIPSQNPHPLLFFLDAALCYQGDKRDLINSGNLIESNQGVGNSKMLNMFLPSIFVF